MCSSRPGYWSTHGLHPDLLHMPREQLPALGLSTHVRRHMLSVHVKRLNPPFIAMLPEERSLHDRVLVPTELTIVGAQPDS